MDAEVLIMTACVKSHDGTTVAQIERVLLGGGTQTVTVDGVAEQRQHPMSEAFHVRLLSPDRMIPDELRETDTYDAAVELALKYAGRRAEHQARIDDLARDLRV